MFIFRNKYFLCDSLIMKLILRYSKFVLFVTLFFCLLILLTTYYASNIKERDFFNENYMQLGGSHVTQSVCHLPIDANPFDDSVKKYMNALSNRIVCVHENDTNNQLTRIDEFGVLRQSDAAFKCKYQFFERMQNNDNKLVYGQLKQLDPIGGALMLNNSFVAVECVHNKDNYLYKNAHYWYPVLKNRRESSQPVLNVQKPSVLILVVESLSRINFLRFMPKTKESFEKLGDIVYMKGLTKMADNSLPNMTPLLTGKRLYNHELDNENNGPYDNWPFVWKLFSQSGYKTAFIEDFPSFTLFNYNANGFKRKPTDWYPRPFWLHIYHEIYNFIIDLMPFELSNCYNERYPKIDMFLRQITHFVRQCELNFDPYFIFSFTIPITHNDFNKAQLIDTHLSTFFEEMRPQLSDSIVILMGDHGNRFGPVLQTVIGRIEERMPLFAIRIPDAIRQTYPHLQTYLQSNSAKLMTWLDVHQLLMDIANHNYSDIGSTVNQRTVVLDRHYYSPWREHIPLWRNCQNSLIPDNYCVCDERKTLNASEQLVKHASQALIQHINLIIPQSLCHNLSIKSIIYAEAILPSDSTAQPKGFELRIEVTVEVSPSNAILRAQLSRHANSLIWSVKGDITRLNVYGKQSNCVKLRQLKLLCYCFNFKRKYT